MLIFTIHIRKETRNLKEKGSGKSKTTVINILDIEARGSIAMIVYNIIMMSMFLLQRK